jgi:hypothetical protein
VTASRPYLLGRDRVLGNVLGLDAVLRQLHGGARAATERDKPCRSATAIAGDGRCVR